MPDLASVSVVAAYALLAGLVFAESGVLLGFFLPGDTVLFGAGLLSGGDHPRLSLPVLILVVLPAAIAGYQVAYWFGGRSVGRARSARARRHLERAQRFYDRYGGFAVVAARWIPWVRTFTPILAGTARMPQRMFVTANVVGAVCWGVTLLVAGHVTATLR